VSSPSAVSGSNDAAALVPAGTTQLEKTGREFLVNESGRERWALQAQIGVLSDAFLSPLSP
jgi:hypothetical protein